jgi:hypothetical protein
MKKCSLLSVLIIFLFIQIVDSAHANAFQSADTITPLVNGGRIFNLVGPLGPNELTARENIVDISSIKGLAGATGATDLPLTPGILGPQGPVGEIGLPGPQGSVGETGPQGAIGAQGVSGLQGLSGAAGAQGLKGITGVAGSIGPLGPVGSQGATGAIGPMGPVGSQGATGAIGPMGPVGSQGATGSQGIQGLTGAASTVVGPQGPIGETGAQGGFGAHGSFSSTESQLAGVSQITAVTFNSKDNESTSGVSLVEKTRITFAKAGTYNIEFSVQLRNKDAAKISSNTAIWLSRNGTAIPLTASWIYYDKYNQKSIEGWNFFVTVGDSDYCELMWWDKEGNTEMLAEPEQMDLLGIPAVPSVILTVNQVG